MNVTLPDFVDYPQLFSLKENKELFKNVYSYVIEPYKLEGISLYVGFRDEHVFTRFADWSSNNINLSGVLPPPSVAYVLERLASVVTLLKAARIADCILHFTNEEIPVLVDTRLSANKFVGPGMLRDLFGKIFKTQVVRHIAVIDDAIIENNHGCIVKPSRFRDMMLNGNISRPLYGVIDTGI